MLMLVKVFEEAASLSLLLLLRMLEFRKMGERVRDLVMLEG